MKKKTGKSLDILKNIRNSSVIVWQQVNSRYEVDPANRRESQGRIP